MNNMKGLFFSILVGALVSSCGGAVSSSYDISSKENLDKCIDKAKTEFGESLEFYSFTASTDVRRDCKLEMMFLETPEKAKNYLVITGGVTESDLLFEKDLTNINLKKFDDIDTEFIMKKYDEAKKLIESKTSEFENFKLKEFRLDVLEADKMDYSLTLSASQKEVKPTQYGERIAAKDPRFTFDVSIDESGTVSLDE